MSSFGIHLRSSTSGSAHTLQRGVAGGVWWPRFASMVVWGVVGYATLYWGLRLTRDADGPSRVPMPVTVPDIDSQAVARALGAGGGAPVVAPAADGVGRYALVGVLAGSAAPQGHGVALITIEGQKPQPFPVGAVVDGQWVVQRVTARGVTLRPVGAPSGDSAGLDLSMPEPKAAGR